MTAADKRSVVELDLAEPARLGLYFLEQVLGYKLMCIRRCVVHHGLICVVTDHLICTAIHFNNAVILGSDVNPITGID